VNHPNDTDDVWDHLNTLERFDKIVEHTAAPKVRTISTPVATDIVLERFECLARFDLERKDFLERRCQT
jgi:hypothetical protein